MALQRVAKLAGASIIGLRVVGRNISSSAIGLRETGFPGRFSGRVFGIKAEVVLSKVRVVLSELQLTSGISQP